MIHAASRQALEELRLQLGLVVDAMPVAGSPGDSQRQLADELYSVSDLLAGQPRLRRTLADPSTDSSSRAGLVRSLLAGKLSEPAIGVAAAAVQQRWSSPWDLTDALAIAADDVLLASADLAGELDEVEDELFRFERILDSSPALTAALDEAAVPAERRNGLLDSVVAGRVRVTTLALLRHAVLDQRKRSVALAIDDLLAASAARRGRSVARVLSAVPLTDAQTQRLATALSRIYGRQISVRSAVDPTVQGGLIVRVGDEVIDGSVASRLTAARIALAG